MSTRRQRGVVWAVVAALVSRTSVAAPEPMDVTLRVQGAPVEGAGCTGGDWTLAWQGQIPGDGDGVHDMLLSYSSLDTTHEEDWQGPPVSLSVTPVTCRDEKGNVVVSSSMGGGERLVRGVIALRKDPLQKSPFFYLDVNDAGTCRMNFAGTGQELAGYPLGIRTQEMVSLSPSLEVTAAELAEGFEKRYAISGSILPLAPFCMGHRIQSGELTLRYKRRDGLPKLLLAGCVNLEKGRATTVQASASPAGGELRFESAPAGMLSIQPQGSSARVTGATPGRGELKGTYTYRGRTATASLPASSVELVSVNGGRPLPVMGYYGIDGKPGSKVYSIPVEVHPAGAGDLLVFKAENEAIVSVVTGGGTVSIQPVREGRTLVQAKTLCGEPVGAPVEIEIRTCDEDVHRELTQMKERATRREREIVRRITQITGSEEFQRAGTEIASHATTLAIKTGELIAATLTGAQATAVRNGTAAALTLKEVESATAVWDASGIINDANAGNIASGAVSLAVMAINKWYVSALKSAIEAGLAAEDLGRDLGTLAGAVEQLELLDRQHDQAIRELLDITRRVNICEQLPPPPPLPPKKETPRPRPPAPPAEQQAPEPVEIAVEELSSAPEQQAGEEVAPPEGPEDPQDLPGRAALCIREVDEPASSEGLRAIAQATQDFRTVAQRAREVFDGFAASLRVLEQSASQGEAAQLEALRSIDAPFNAAVEQLFALGEASRAYGKRFEPCTEGLPAGIASLKTRYGP